jgi:hypothetical protein
MRDSSDSLMSLLPDNDHDDDDVSDLQYQGLQYQG